MIGPPAGVDPADLFLTLLEWRPERAIRYRLPELPDVVLGVRAVSAADYERALRAGPSALLAACLTAEAERALLAETIATLDAICPLYRRIDSAAWDAVLRRGAQAVPGVARGFVSSVDILPTGGKEPLKREHPERYWGRPPCELLDGHWLAFRAASDLIYR